jgi:hypothetical protein
MFKKSIKTCTSAAVASHYALSSTPSTFSAMNTPENKEEDQNLRRYQNGILL